MSRGNKKKTEIATGRTKRNVLLEISKIYYNSDVSIRVIPERSWRK